MTTSRHQTNLAAIVSEWLTSRFHIGTSPFWKCNEQTAPTGVPAPAYRDCKTHQIPASSGHPALAKHHFSAFGNGSRARILTLCLVQLLRHQSCTMQHEHHHHHHNTPVFEPTRMAVKVVQTAVLCNCLIHITTHRPCLSINRENANCSCRILTLLVFSSMRCIVLVRHLFFSTGSTVQFLSCVSLHP